MSSEVPDTCPQSTIPGARNTRRRYVILAVLLGFVSSVYFTCFTYAHQITEEDGWKLEFAYLRFRCQTCLGRIKSLTCQGRQIPDMNFEDVETMEGPVMLDSPVGTFMYQHGHQRLWHGTAQTLETSEAITQDELQRGYYDPRDTGEDEADSGFPRKTETPVHWCLVRYLDRAYWIDPAKLGEIIWD